MHLIYSFYSIRKKNGEVNLESVISVLILLVLILIGTLIYLQQFRFDEEKFNAQVIQAGKSAENSGEKISIDISEIMPKGYSPMSDQEFFDPGTLSDKINGKAETYLDSGFVQLTCRRFVSTEDPNRWFEFFAYDMDRPRNAFAVYSTQRREGVSSLKVAKFSYSTENAVFFVHGPYYVEIIGAQPGKELMQSMISMSEEFVETFPADVIDIPELSFLPAENLNIDSVSIILKNGFGFEKLDNLVTGVYRINGYRMMVFVSDRSTTDEAEELVNAYKQFLSELIGGDELTSQTGQVPGLIIVDVFGEYEMFFSKGKVFGGIHAARDLREGETFAAKLYNKIKEIQQ